MFFINVEGAVYRGDKWLMIERSHKEEHAGGMLSFVGGTVDQEGASSNILERTLRRELMEEVGIKVHENMTYVRNTSFVLPDGREVVDIVFLCEWQSGEPYPKSPDEVEAVHWMTTEEIINHPRTESYLHDNISEADRLRNLPKHSTNEQETNRSR
ncbi:NUDIX domain-containing protein [Sutcliffiella horikoshii]|uniref:NUDIX domain-containing protein n=1 Tax=Sutcliffiella horikoshii TaxID=79883 RepID=A0A5D4T0Q5_9BACI|nr:NUDIX domain-containing protein [Sutcliffiella horikoshii]TYS68082.1 NUDIX domain-containing protein [Sutcliffiella horikoshii]